MELINEGEFEVPIVSEFSSINEYRVTDYGELYILVKEFEETEERRIFKNYNYKNTHVYLLTGDDYETETIELEDNKRIEAMTFRVDDKRNFTITGTYGDFDARGVTGMFYKQLNFDTGDVGVLSYEEFSEDFITQDWSDRSKKKMEKKKKKGKDVTPILYNYIMRQAELLKDGSIVGSMEQYYVRVVTTTDPRTGATRTTYYYYYKDIIAFKLNKDGEFDWVQKIDKYQVSTNDNGYFSSYCRYIDGEKLCFLFNDNSDNYDEGSDEYSVTDNAPASSRMSKKKNTVALCTIDLESGDVERKMFFDREELGALAVPKLFNVDYLNNEVLLYAVRWKKEQFGVMDIN